MKAIFLIVNFNEDFIRLLNEGHFKFIFIFFIYFWLLLYQFNLNFLLSKSLHLTNHFL
jgi:hypothetical protein